MECFVLGLNIQSVESAGVSQVERRGTQQLNSPSEFVPDLSAQDDSCVDIHSQQDKSPRVICHQNIEVKIKVSALFGLKLCLQSIVPLNYEHRSAPVRFGESSLKESETRDVCPVISLLEKDIGLGADIGERVEKLSG